MTLNQSEAGHIIKNCIKGFATKKFHQFITMAVSVNITDSNVTIANTIKNTSITLDLISWESLVACREEVSKSLAAKKDGNWMLHPGKNIRVSLSTYLKFIYIHIREWKKDNPTAKGVSFHEKDWQDLSEYFVSSNESQLAKKVMTTMMRLETKSKMKQNCEGCVKGYASQKDHDCLMNASTLAYVVMEKIDIKPQDFILMMAQEAAKQGFVLERPHLAYKRVKNFQMDAIKGAVINADYDF